jgi:2-C-methyl-D-erythritol 4-phosphate cytidylyltransferase
MNIVIPAAGMGSRFVTAGYTIPKPFLPIKGKPMVEWVIDNFWTPGDKVYLLMRSQDMTYLQGSSLAYKSGLCFIPVDRPTEGAACTVLTRGCCW